ncbi:MAG: histidine kinase [bacterium]|nr:histidine kinase [bacterium]
MAVSATAHPERTRARRDRPPRAGRSAPDRPNLRETLFSFGASAPERVHLLGYLLMGVVVGITLWYSPRNAFDVVVVVLGSTAYAVGIVLRKRYPLIAPIAAATLILPRNLMLLPVASFSLGVNGRGRWARVTMWAMAALLVIRNTGITIDYVREGLSRGPVDVAIQLTALPIMVIVLPALMGRYVTYNRRLVARVREQAAQLREDRVLRERNAIYSERQRIAQEMHDSLGHRLALLTMQAGALEVNAGAGPATVRDLGGLIQATSSEAIEELTEAVGALRAGGEEAAPKGVDQLPPLLEASRGAGTVVTVEDQSGALDGGLSPALDHTVYRVIQEGLTNAYRYSPGRPVTIRLEGAPGADLTLTIANPLGALSKDGPVGTGSGLRALSHRVEAMGGWLTTHRGESEFVLTASVPWSMEGAEE